MTIKINPAAYFPTPEKCCPDADCYDCETFGGCIACKKLFHECIHGKPLPDPSVPQFNGLFAYVGQPRAMSNKGLPIVSALTMGKARYRIRRAFWRKYRRVRNAMNRARNRRELMSA